MTNELVYCPCGVPEHIEHACTITQQPLLEENARLRAALEQIRDYHVIQGMSPALFAEKVLQQGHEP